MSATVDKTIFFFKARTGEPAGTFVLPRPQTEFENCTWHNYNVVPTDKRYVLVSGNYQSGISVVDFTNPANANEIAYADPAPLSSTSLVLGGDWSTLLVQRPHLRVRHQARPNRLGSQRRRGGRRKEARPPEPADRGDLLRDPALGRSRNPI